MKIFTVITRTKNGKVKRIVRENRIIVYGTRAQIEAELVMLRDEPGLPKS